MGRSVRKPNAGTPPYQSSTQDINLCIEEDGKNIHKGQLVPSSLRDIESLSPTDMRLSSSPTERLSHNNTLQIPSLNRNKFTAPRIYVPPIESRYFDVTYGYAEGTSSSSTPYAPIIRVPLPPPDIIPPSTPTSF